ncbi:MAG: histidinol-phosphate transaminase [Nitrospirae bacterium]|nr:MAG: histidinol-phosphate transaminase [Nitrospirota bacterium]
MNSLIRRPVRKLKPYEPKLYDVPVKLDANELPYGFEDLLKEALNVSTNRYPDPYGRALKEAVSKLWKVPRTNILLGNGSDELIYYIVGAFGGPVMYPVPTFSMYGIIATGLGEKTIALKLDKDFDIPIKRFLSAIQKHRPKVIFLSIPNNPTGNVFSSDRVEAILKTTNGVVVIDEAYQAFSSTDYLPFLKKYPNLLIMRTLSKVGFAGLRVGFLIGSKEMIEVVNRLRLPFNVNALSQAIARAALENFSLIKERIETVKRQRQALYSAMKEIKGIEPFPSEANFILFRTKAPKKVFKGLLKRGVLIRDLTEEVPNCLRVTVGSPEENSIFIQALKESLK